jgi:hypothetical protein
MVDDDAVKRPKGRVGPVGVASKGTSDPPQPSPENESRIQLLNER